MANYNLTQTGDEVQAYIDSIPVIDVSGTQSGSTITFGSNPYTQIAANYAADCGSIVRLTVGTAVYFLRVTQYDGTNYTAAEMSGAHNVVATIGSSSASATIDAGIDTTPTQGSNNLVTSGAIWAINTNALSVNLAYCGVELKDGVIYSNGNPANSTSYKRTSMIPVKNGKGFIVEGAVVYMVAYYNAMVLNSSAFVSSFSNPTHTPPTNGKYAVIVFRNSSNTDGYDNLKIGYVADFLAKYPESPIEVRQGGTSKTEAKYLLLNAIKLISFTGSSVDSTNSQYNIAIANASTYSRLRVYNDTTLLLDTGERLHSTPKSDVEAISLVDTGYDFGMIIDWSQFYNKSLAYKICFLTEFAFSKYFGNINDIAEIEENLNTISASVENIEETINNAESIEVLTDEVSETDLSAAFTENGAVFYNNGTGNTSSTFRKTDYIDVRGFSNVKAHLPNGSSGGLAFYDASRVAITDYMGTTNAGYNYRHNDVWMPIPANAAYMRACKLATDESVLFLQKFVSKPLQDIAYNVYSQHIRSTDVLANWKEIGMSKSRLSLTQSTLDEDAKQIISKFEQYLARTELQLTFRATSADTFIGCGYQSQRGAVVRTEVRVSGNTFSIYSGVLVSGDTMESGSMTIVFTDTLPFTLTNGNIYRIGINKLDNNIGENSSVENGGIFYAEDMNGHRYEKKILKTYNDSATYNGIRSGIITILLGNVYVSLKQGSADIIDFYLKSSFTPHAKVLLTGDSLVAGDTMIADGMEKRYCALLQDAIGNNNFVIDAIGGLGASSAWLTYLTREIDWFCPDYVIIELGCNAPYGETAAEKVEAQKLYINSALKMLANHNVKPILQTITPRNNGGTLYNTYLESINSWIRNLGVTYVDVNAAVSDDGVTYKNGYCFTDGTHPNVLGHQAIYDAFVKELPEIFGNNIQG